jgi:hypothetical protein
VTACNGARPDNKIVARDTKTMIRPAQEKENPGSLRRRESVYGVSISRVAERH